MLSKHEPGKPLTLAERRQRRNAALSRWGLLATGAGAGAAIGAGVAGARRAVLSSERAEAQARLTGVLTADRITAVLRQVEQSGEQARERFTQAVRFRQRANPETARERNQRFRATMENPMTAPRAPRGLVIGTAKNARIYDYQIDRQQRLVRVEQAHLERLVRDTDEYSPSVRRQRAKVLSAQRDLEELKQLRQHAPKMTARSGSTQIRRGQKVEVNPTVEAKFRRGETGKKLTTRINAERRALNAKLKGFLDLETRHRAGRRVIAQERVLTESMAAVRQAFEHGDYRWNLLRSSGKGALVGGAIGLTAAGLGLLAGHVLRAGEGKKRQPPVLAKASPPSPEDSMGTGMARAYRAWIDRLLGRSDQPMNLGDDVAVALGPGLSESFADGLRSPPIAREESAPGSWIDWDFDVINPAQRRHMAEYTLNRIVQITAEQREAIRKALMDQAVMAGKGPYEVARAIKEVIGLTPYQQSMVNGFREGLRNLDPRVLERQLRDRRFDPTLRRAIERNEALSEEQIEQMTDAYHRRAIALRSRTIARTEGLRATSYGSLARAQEVLDENPDLEVTKRWLSTDDERTRDTHRDLQGKEVEGILTNFVTSHGNLIRWPLDQEAAAEEVINCRCRLQFVFRPKRGQLVAVSV